VRDQGEDPIETPPEGASCGEHPERDALVVCPRCGSFCCLACWHNSVRRCHVCLMKDPGPPVAWEDPRRALPMRFLVTLADAFRPNRAAPSLARGDWRAALSFFALTFIPLGLLAGVIPLTATLGFGGWRVQLLGTPTTTEIVIDVLRAGAISLVVVFALLVLLTLPYYSLSRAYGSRGHPAAPISVMLYRGWLLPFAGVAYSITVWSFSGDVSTNMQLLLYFAVSIWFVLLFSSMLATARMASGVGPIAALAVVLVPFVVLALSLQLGLPRLEPLLPDVDVAQAQPGPSTNASPSAR
jgi:hypothetical protein